VGGPDGGPGLIGTGWSTEHGDVRVPHFVGLHALQVLAIGVLVARRAGIRRGPRARLMLVAGPGYAALFGILLLQALRGVPLGAPDAATIAQIGIWGVATLVAAVLAVRGDADAPRHTVAI
jgi:hypothetical protein